jgi:biopolymer transport protein ExbD
MDKSRKRMRFAAGAEPEAPTINMVPMIDLVFQLICFYMFVTRSFATLEDPNVQLPLMHRSNTAEVRPVELTVNIRADDSLTLNGSPIRLGDLSGVLAAERRRSAPSGAAGGGGGATAAEGGGGVTVVVRADRRQTFARLDDVLAACRAARFEQVCFRAEEAPE